MSLCLRRFVRLLSLTVLFLSGCTKPETSNVSGDVRVLMPSVAPDGTASFEIRTLTGVDDLSVMKTRFAIFHFAPKITPDGLDGTDIHTHFMKDSDGVYVPRDSTTQNVVKIAAEMEDLSKLDEKMGTHDLLSWPASIGYAVRLTDNSRQIENNSFYDSVSDSILFVPFSDDSHLPLTLNAGVIGHEHFHVIFDRLVMRSLLAAELINPDLRATGDQKKVERTVMLKSINEGLADVWGWIHSGDLAFIAKSISSQLQPREMKIKNDPVLMYSHQMHSRLYVNQQVDLLIGFPNPPDSFASFSYAPGTELSRAVLDVFQGDRDASSQELRDDLALRLVRALPDIAKRFKDDEATPVELTDILQLIVNAAPLAPDQVTRAQVWLPVKAGQ